MQKNIEELTLLLMYLSSWEEDGCVMDEKEMIKEAKIRKCWKGYLFDVINKLTDENYLYFSKGKSVSITPKGEEFAKELIKKYIKE